ncbi:N-acetylated-alpha-linked acidic dipeptidase 2-like isoform X2 [Mytilus galloprovincialis]|uniref:N-acetylated-alpha-linked acidic dipeptidase 2-like isoform X2 n=1 Tax=Mytilus galloprovincialis TaxID=29158 RepID=UPI003F7C6A38
MEMSDSNEYMFKDANRRHANRKIWICGAVAIIVGFVIGILIGRFATCPEEKVVPKQDGTFLQGVSDSIIKDGDPKISEEILNGIRAENIREYLRDLTEYPHLAGTPADWEQADKLRKFWTDNGLDEVFISEYDVLLSYPNTTDEDNMNQIQIVDNSTGNIIYKSPLYEDILDESENKSNVVPPFNAYSKPGTVESDQLIYVNYGRVEDYTHLDSLNINVSGKIVIARYGKIFRGDKANLAYMHGAIGIILYSDPEDYAMGQTDTSQVYPHDWWLPASGVQRGTIFLRSGDPLTPGYPATETAYRLGEDEPEAGLPKIITHPVGYGVAEKILQQMTGDNVPLDWEGKVPNVTYRYGGQLTNSTWRVKMRISTANKRVKTYNVIGIIRGAIEPDRYILMGNHRDAWVFGAIDPSSGTAVMKEVSRVMGQLVKSNKWRPRRSIIFCSWGAEEYKLVGSVEWVEQYVKNLAERSLAYLNVDKALEGNFSLRALSTPLLYDVIFSATKKVLNPDSTDIHKTVYDKWKASFPKDSSDHHSVPRVSGIGAGSDYAPMVQMVGLPSCDIRYTFDHDKYQLSSDPLYHSKYETFKMVDQIMDRGFKHHQATARVWAEMARALSDTMVIPFDVVNFANELLSLVNTLDEDYGTMLRNQSIIFDDFKKVTDNLKAEAMAFKSRLRNVNKYKHILFAESKVNTYAGSSFPGLVDSLFQIEKDPDQKGRWNIVKKHFSVILFTIESATSTLRDVTKFMPVFNKDGS